MTGLELAAIEREFPNALEFFDTACPRLATDPLTRFRVRRRSHGTFQTARLFTEAPATEDEWPTRRAGPLRFAEATGLHPARDLKYPPPGNGELAAGYAISPKRLLRAYWHADAQVWVRCTFGISANEINLQVRWLKRDMQEAVFKALSAVDRVPYLDEDVERIVDVATTAAVRELSEN